MRSSGKKLVVELDGKKFSFSRNKAVPVDQATKPSGDLWIVSDLEAGEPRVQDVGAPAKYAQTVLQRNIQDSGIFSTSGHVLPHWSRDTSPTTSKVYFSAVESAVFGAYSVALTQKGGHTLLFPTNALLLAVQRHYSKKGNTAVFLLHGRHLDLLVGQGQQVIAASRLTAYSHDQEALAGLEMQLADELRSIEGENRCKIEHVVALLWGVKEASDALKPKEEPLLSMHPGEALEINKPQFSSKWPIFPAWLDDLEKRLDRKVTIPDVRSYSLPKGGQLLTSVPSVCGILKVADSANTQQDKFLYHAHRILPILTLLMALVVGGLYHFATLQNENSDRLEIKERDLSEQMHKQMLKAPTPFRSRKFEKTLALSNKLEKLAQHRHFGQILSDLTETPSGNMQLSQVDINYGDGEVVIILSGRFQASFEVATVAHQNFISKLKEKGYRLTDSQSRGSLDEVVFTMTLGYKEGR